MNKASLKLRYFILKRDGYNFYFYYKQGFSGFHCWHTAIVLRFVLNVYIITRY